MYSNNLQFLHWFRSSWNHIPRIKWIDIYCFTQHNQSMVWNNYNIIDECMTEFLYFYLHSRTVVVCELSQPEHTEIIFQNFPVNQYSKMKNFTCFNSTNLIFNKTGDEVINVWKIRYFIIFLFIDKNCWKIGNWATIWCLFDSYLLQEIFKL